MTLIDQLPTDDFHKIRKQRQLKRYYFLLFIGGLIFVCWSIIEAYFLSQQMYDLPMPNSFTHVSENRLEPVIVYLIVGMIAAQLIYLYKKLPAILFLIAVYLSSPVAFVIFSHVRFFS